MLTSPLLALKDAEHVLQDILHAIDTSKDGLIQFEGNRGNFANLILRTSLTHYHRIQSLHRGRR